VIWRIAMKTYKNKKTGILWQLIEIQSGGLLCYCPQVNKKYLLDEKLLKKNFEEIKISKLNNGGKTK